MNAKTLDGLLDALPGLRIGVVGDFCLDAYWTLDMSLSERSIETGIPTRPVRRQQYSLGGAGNVVNNLVAMGVGSVAVFGVIGDDPFGWDMRRLLAKLRVGLDGLLTQGDGWDTPVYIKPIIGDREDHRLDFGNFNTLHADTTRVLLDALGRVLPDLDGLIINEQLVNGIHSTAFQDGLNALIGRYPKVTFVADCRCLAGVYRNCVYKLNACEAARLCGMICEPDALVPFDQTAEHLRDLYGRWGQPVFVTRGARGCVVQGSAGMEAVPGLHIVGRTDPVGAGDSMVAGLTAALAAGYPPVESACFGNFVAGVTVQKIFQTGTATPEEIRAIGASPDYLYQPELADDPRGARRVAGTDIEIVETFPAGTRILHAIFDHDGTLSTLREGWEQVMEPMMVKAILGPRYESADEGVYARVVGRVRDFIDKTTGIQTLEQMQGLADMVREFGFVSSAEVLDAAGYKRIYNDALLAIVRDRMARLERGERDVTDYTLKGAVALLRRLHAAGVSLYLASGTDQEDVEREARALGYADLFEGRLYGAVGDINREAKRIVLERIMQGIGPSNMACLVTFGDGPVEIRETRKRGGLAVGVASDELRRFGLNEAKRRRLIRAGAHVLVPDFAQLDALFLQIGIPAVSRRAP
ncbi:MAG: hypothetical protein A2498_11305 [Lentisphaerae bacterium RIFOXYC12_FULL_60_16]|nr:MAG: hypothetical protein A2498_11305 [Lentisphaerae bacterium RIFOXYC12_FULL_60_16]OGV73824.1 MAG: hypothetical protein A2269_08025 [Lentisphaerae bacterium RIFOXYA12_FULL_60_10]OGV85978.1 MAG: hypothetical protein A2340_16330 [Lentisphaerae bacterium RIFOXYB12_FULL_60_10]